MPKNGHTAMEEPRAKTVMTIDIGGSSVKILTNAGGEKRKFKSGPEMTPQDMVDGVHKLAEGLSFDAVSIGYPGPVRNNRPTKEPENLGHGWVDFDFAAAFSAPVRMVNDALMQAIGSYEGGRMLFIGLGTGLGSALVLEKVAQPLELAHLPYKKGKTFEEYVGEHGLKERGAKKWRKSVFDVIARLDAAILPDYIVIGGGNVDDLEELPAKCRRGSNANAFEGGFRLWTDESLVIHREG